MAFDHSKFLARFVEEAREHCSRISEGLLNLEHAPGDAELINGLFRSAHTIKGSSRMMKLMGVTELAHKMEDILDSVRGNRLALSPALADLLFKGTDALQAMLEQITAGNKNPEAPDALCALLGSAAGGEEPQPAPSSPPAPEPPRKPVEPPVAAASAGTPPSRQPPGTTGGDAPPASAPAPRETAADDPAAARPAAKKGQADYLRVNAHKLDELIRLMGEIVSEHGRFRRDVSRLGDLERKLAQYQDAVHEHLKRCAPGDAGSDELKQAGTEVREALRDTVRVIRNATLMQDHLIGDLRETSMKMRMQPLSTVFDPLRRTVREISQEVGKQIDFIVEGGETELDRKIIDRIGDSLVHLIRNALDHGMESTTERVAAGKPPQGTIMLSACYDGGCVTIALSDDGRGIPVERVREKALAKRLFDAETLDGMSRAELINIIFMPGFSTSPIITDLSGRGVGMDVVRKSVVEELKGTVLVDTAEGAGTTFLLRLPLNLAVFPLFRVAVCGKVCALPATAIVEMLAVPVAELIEIVDKRAIRLREQLIPVEHLAALLGLSRDDAPRHNEVLIVIIRDGEEKLGLIVDDVISREEMVVKPLPGHLKNLHLVSGVSIGERNSILNLLHVPELLRLAREIAEPGRRMHQAGEQRAATILVVDDSYNTREIEKSILEAHGYEVDVGVDGEDGFEKTRQKRYDLVITDVEMPRLDGFSLTERLRADERYHLVPVIIVTSREKDEDKRRGIQVGADAYIVKGAFDQTNLVETVRSLIG